jgi:EpsI family protein
MSAVVPSQAPVVMPLRAAIMAAVLLLAALPVAEMLRPTHRTSDIRGPVQLSTQVPERFGTWQVDRALVPVLPDPRLQSTLDATYTQVLARTYIDTQGRRVMLSIAYGDDQSSDATAVHRPEFCYRGQGFQVEDAGLAAIELPDHVLTTQRLIGRLENRLEPITYWITLDETATLPGMGRKLQQLRYGLRGYIADGMVMRVSTIGIEPAVAFKLQAEFVTQLHAALPEALRARYFGAGADPR